MPGGPFRPPLSTGLLIVSAWADQSLASPKVRAYVQQCPALGDDTMSVGPSSQVEETAYGGFNRISTASLDAVDEDHHSDSEEEGFDVADLSTPASATSSARASFRHSEVGDEIQLRHHYHQFALNLPLLTQLE